jgi:hypothetical protein
LFFRARRIGKIKDVGLRWQAQRDTAVIDLARDLPSAKAPSALRSAGALQSERVM